MKELRKMLTLLFMIYWFTYVLGKCLLDYFSGDQVEIVAIMLSALGWGVLPALGSYAGLSQVVMPKLRYLESEIVEEPTFFEKREERVSNENGAITFTNLEEICRARYVVTFADGEEGVIKMRTTLSLWSWGVGYFIKLEKVDQAVVMVSIPISTRNRKVEQDAKRLKLLVEGLASAS